MSDSDPPRDSAPNQPRDAPPDTNKLDCNEIRKFCKNESYELYQTMKHNSDAGMPVPLGVVARWMGTVKELNRAMSRYARAVDASERRLRLELELLRQAVTLDNLDREATFTSTLEALKAFEVGAQRADGSNPQGTTEFTDNAVMKAMNIVSSINVAMSGITDSAEPDCGDAAQCLVMRGSVADPSSHDA
jgi:hypothetical protein